MDIVPARPGHVGHLIGLMTAALADDPAFSRIEPDGARRRAALDAVVRTAVVDSARGGTADVAVRDGLPVGVACWHAPGRYPMGRARKVLAIPTMIRGAVRAGQGFLRFARMGAALDTRFPADPVLYLQLLAIDPEHQGTGVGTALLRHGLARADIDGIDVYLETGNEANVAYYERAGFVLTESVEELFDGGPPMWFMRRPASGSGP